MTSLEDVAVSCFELNVSKTKRLLEQFNKKKINDVIRSFRHPRLGTIWSDKTLMCIALKSGSLVAEESAGDLFKEGIADFLLGFPGGLLLFPLSPLGGLIKIIKAKRKIQKASLISLELIDNGALIDFQDGTPIYAIQIGSTDLLTLLISGTITIKSKIPGKKPRTITTSKVLEYNTQISGIGNQTHTALSWSASMLRPDAISLFLKESAGEKNLKTKEKVIENDIVIPSMKSAGMGVEGIPKELKNALRKTKQEAVIDILQEIFSQTELEGNLMFRGDEFPLIEEVAIQNLLKVLEFLFLRMPYKEGQFEEIRKRINNLDFTKSSEKEKEKENILKLLDRVSLKKAKGQQGKNISSEFTVQNVPDVCGWCVENISEYVCSSCQTVSYCSRECQEFHWVYGNHPENCSYKNKKSFSLTK